MLYFLVMEDYITKIQPWLQAGSINFFGPQFSGKDTQGQILADIFNGVLIAGGDILRSHQERADVQQAMQHGDYAPTDAYREIVIPYFKKPEFHNKPLFLSSVGRMHGEEDAVMEAAESSGHPMKAVIVLHLNEAEIWHRFEVAQKTHDRGDRADDSREALKTRLEKYNTGTELVIDFYRQKNLLIEIDGSQTEAEVTEEILKTLADKTTA